MKKRGKRIVSKSWRVIKGLMDCVEEDIPYMHGKNFEAFIDEGLDLVKSDGIGVTDITLIALVMHKVWSEYGNLKVRYKNTRNKAERIMIRTRQKQIKLMLLWLLSEIEYFGDDVYGSISPFVKVMVRCRLEVIKSELEKAKVRNGGKTYEEKTNRTDR